MNRFQFTCQYCDFSWGVNYTPHEKVHCSKCRDTNIRVVDNNRDKIDYYEGCPPFKNGDNDWNV